MLETTLSVDIYHFQLHLSTAYNPGIQAVDHYFHKLPIHISTSSLVDIKSGSRPSFGFHFTTHSYRYIRFCLHKTWLAKILAIDTYPHSTHIAVSKQHKEICS